VCDSSSASAGMMRATKTNASVNLIGMRPRNMHETLLGEQQM
jgi:hypothetical protein